MPALRLPQSAEPLLPFCHRYDEPLVNACFNTYADLLTFVAACGFHRFHGRLPDQPQTFLTKVYPIDLAVFKNQGLFPNLLLICLGAEGTSGVARDEERLCRIVEAFADVGSKYLSHELASWTPSRFHLEVAALLCSSTKTDDLPSI